MESENYTSPEITVLGEVSDLTQAKKQGILTDLGHSSSGLVKVDLDVDLLGLPVVVAIS